MLEPGPEPDPRPVLNQGSLVACGASTQSTQTELNLCEASTQTELCAQSIVQLEEYQTLTCRINEHEFTEGSLKDNDVKVKFYTGLPSYAVLLLVFKFVSASINLHHRSALSNFQQFCMTLMKLRLNLFDQDIGYRFGVSQSTVSKNFRKWINA